MPELEQSGDTKQAILRVAAEEFERAGYSGATIGAIASRLGVTKSVISYHFPSKAELAQAVVSQRYGDFADVVRGLDLSGLEALIVVSMVAAHQFETDTSTRAAIRLQRESSQIGIDLPSPYAGRIRLYESMLTEESDAILLAGWSSRAAMAQAIVASLAGVTMVHARLGGDGEIADRVLDYWRLTLPGLTTRDSDALLARAQGSFARWRTLIPGAGAVPVAESLLTT
ncbi:MULTISPECIES: TetR/AcrR family transcriptional regulator [Clavibacter]|uniref:TetR/AcrR family transcriptional regulator n=2 Tax=Clavibacter TaxID=1573 RepID=A0A399NY72_9MICO|nr:MULTISPECIES: TetR/AcrR family transcriptional regulator [Clavibacter]KDP89818.1 hypothetical protein W824_15095 [Clavibacter cf. michiganensis LMG 26808]RII99092.1 TetR/AcrR family transcriptional regulator [Clavibacter michiganensis]UKF26711.1 TetR/AcrR family transcriptional regulator [Clavibacter sp. A6099]